MLGMKPFYKMLIVVILFALVSGQQMYDYYGQDQMDGLNERYDDYPGAMFERDDMYGSGSYDSSYRGFEQSRQNDDSMPIELRDVFDSVGVPFSYDSNFVGNSVRESGSTDSSSRDREIISSTGNQQTGDASRQSSNDNSGSKGNKISLSDKKQDSAENNTTKDKSRNIPCSMRTGCSDCLADVYCLYFDKSEACTNIGTVFDIEFGGTTRRGSYRIFKSCTLNGRFLFYFIFVSVIMSPVIFAIIILLLVYVIQRCKFKYSRLKETDSISTSPKKKISGSMPLRNLQDYRQNYHMKTLDSFKR